MTDQKPNPLEHLAAKILTFTDPKRVYRIKKPLQDDEIHYAGFNDRAFASVADVALCLMLFYQPMYYLAAMIFGPERAHQLYSLSGLTMTTEQQAAMVNAPGYISAYLANSLMQAFILGSIFIVVWSYSAATPGKWLLRMRIVDEKTGLRPTRRQFIIRFIGAILASLPFMLGFLWMAFDKKKQGWHDKMAGTVVVKVKHWRITPPDVSEYSPAVLERLALESEEVEEEEDYEIVEAPEVKTGKHKGTDA